MLVTVSASYGQIPLLNSDINSAPTIFLDFDGHTVDNTVWNYDGPIYCAASTLTPAQVQDIFNRVAEDYRPFTVNITTDSARYLAAPVTLRMRVILTTSWEWYGSAGGVAFTGSFAWGIETPCFVFTGLLGNNIKYIAEAASHETGHTLGLLHQSTYDLSCVKVSDYNYGIGTGEISWAPIMGVGYYRNLTIWHNGSTPYGCNSVQNDIAIITRAENSISLRPDDAGNTAATAAIMNISNNTFSTAARFNFSNDEDLFKITIPLISMVSLRSIPVNAGSPNIAANSDIQTELLNSSLGVLKTVNPADSLQASLDTLLNPGIYYIRVKPAANTNIGTYGMLGGYIITGSLQPLSALPLRTLKLTGSTAGQKHLFNWLVDADEKIEEMILEYADNNFSFSELAPVHGSTGTHAWIPSAPGKLYYRLKVRFDNGAIYYSNMINLSNPAESPMPEVIGNPVTNGILSIQGISNSNYLLYSNAGSVVQTGRLDNGLNKINVSALSRGIYYIQFHTNNQLVKAQKLVIQ